MIVEELIRQLQDNAKPTDEVFFLDTCDGMVELNEVRIRADHKVILDSY